MVEFTNTAPVWFFGEIDISYRDARVWSSTYKRWVGQICWLDQLWHSDPSVYPVVVILGSASCISSIEDAEEECN